MRTQLIFNIIIQLLSLLWIAPNTGLLGVIHGPNNYAGANKKPEKYKVYMNTNYRVNALRISQVTDSKRQLFANQANCLGEYYPLSISSENDDDESLNATWMLGGTFHNRVAHSMEGGLGYGMSKLSPMILLLSLF
uniref:Uncharacterized protein n=1 Tax=Glossina brevipalpis TaxID=37001 RepID=A0A1A9WA98_9MUSC